MFGKKKKEVVDEDTFHLDKDSMQMGKPDQKPPISVMKLIKRKLIFLLWNFLKNFENLGGINN